MKTPGQVGYEADRDYDDARARLLVAAINEQQAKLPMISPETREAWNNPGPAQGGSLTFAQINKQVAKMMGPG